MSKTQLQEGMVLRYARPDINPDSKLRFRLLRREVQRRGPGWIVEYLGEYRPFKGRTEFFYKADGLLDYYEVEPAEDSKR